MKKIITFLKAGWDDFVRGLRVSDAPSTPAIYVTEELLREQWKSFALLSTTDTEAYYWTEEAFINDVRLGRVKIAGVPLTLCRVHEIGDEYLCFPIMMR